MKSDLSRFDLAGHASAIWLSARKHKTLGQDLPAARGFLEAANLWQRAADSLVQTAPGEAVRQHMNRIVALVDAGDIPNAGQAVKETEARWALLPALPAHEREALRSEWLDVLDGVREAQKAFGDETKAMREELKGKPDLSKLTPATVERWLQRYPGSATSHFMAFRVAEGRRKLAVALSHLNNAIALEPAHLSFLARPEVGSSGAAGGLSRCLHGETAIPRGMTPNFGRQGRIPHVGATIPDAPRRTCTGVSGCFPRAKWEDWRGNCGSRADRATWR